MSGIFDHERDRVRAGRIAGIALAGLLVFAAAAVWSGWIQRGRAGGVRSDARAAHAGAQEIGIVYQRSFDEGIAATKNDAARRRLESAGWVDRDAGVVHVPVEDAMKLVVERGKL